MSGIEKFMRLAISMAEQGIGKTAPNPSVGAVIVKDNVIISAARTSDGGRPHAEFNAINGIARDFLKGADMYVTLEPCAHHGKTPPCAELIASSGIGRVFIGSLDKNPLVNGGGIAILEASNIKVYKGFLKEECDKLNQPFFNMLEKHHPQVTVKIACSMDGKIALENGLSRWITSEKSREFGHLMRAKSDAILIGGNTAIVDDPMLDCRIEGLESSSPIRIVYDPSLKISPESRLVQSANKIPLWVFTQDKKSLDKIEKLEGYGVKILQANDVEAAIKSIAELGIMRLLCEGGAWLNTELIQKQMADYVYIFKSAKFLGDDSKSAISKLGLTEIVDNLYKPFNSMQLDDDVLIMLKKS